MYELREALGWHPHILSYSGDSLAVSPGIAGLAAEPKVRLSWLHGFMVSSDADDATYCLEGFEYQTADQPERRSEGVCGCP